MLWISNWGVFDTIIHVKPSGTGEEGKKSQLESCVLICCELIPAEKHTRLFRGSNSYDAKSRAFVTIGTISHKGFCPFLHDFADILTELTLKSSDFRFLFNSGFGCCCTNRPSDNCEGIFSSALNILAYYEGIHSSNLHVFFLLL